MSAVIDVHTHMLNDRWLDTILEHGGRYSLKELGGQRVIHYDDAPFMTLMDPMFDYSRRIKDMDEAGVDISIVSLTCPSVYWGGEKISTSTAQMMNDDMSDQQSNYPDRIRWFATLPWQYPESAQVELERTILKGCSGVFVSASVTGMSLTDPTFAPIWNAIERADLPVLIHPGAPPGVSEMDMEKYNLAFSVGFMFDTTLAISRMIYGGFFDRYQKVKIIACHAGGALPYLVGRLDTAFNKMPPCREVISEKPSTYFERLYFDSIAYTQEALELCLHVSGSDRLLYGSDYPHNVGDMEGNLERVNALAPDIATKVKGKNAEQLFNL
ncbi:amidohydrolase family protein [Gammaproteobacteria bacterium]|nr:amidohydrolase family protein [Gammaproteobacteria bacterium]